MLSGTHVPEVYGGRPFKGFWPTGRSDRIREDTSFPSQMTLLVAGAREWLQLRKSPGEMIFPRHACVIVFHRATRSRNAGFHAHARTGDIRAPPVLHVLLFDIHRFIALHCTAVVGVRTAWQRQAERVI